MDIQLTFCGAARNVTGSRYLLEANGSKFYVDCGMYQEHDLLERNWEKFKYPPQEIDAVLLTHAHLDHCGLLPKLVKEGFRGRIICTPATADIVKIILLDSARIQEEDAAYKKKRHEREGRKGPYPEEPLYTVEDAERTFPLFEGVEYNTPVRVGDGIEAEFRDAGHVLGSSMIKITFTQGGEQKSIVFSGDIGRWDRPILEDPTQFKKPDYIVTESTYGDRVHDGVKDIKEDLAKIINDAHNAGGHIIVPSFALQRAQEILYYINALRLENRIPHLDVYLDSPMAIRVTNVFKQYEDLFDHDMKEYLNLNESPFNFPGLKMVETVEQSKALNFLKGTAMIIAGSGMVTGGRIKHHLANNISRPEATIMFVGYQAQGTLGRYILDGATSVRIFGQRHEVRAKITVIHGFSAHADRDDLLRWLSALTEKPDKIFITHGEEEAAENYGKFLMQKTGYPTMVPHYGETVRL